VIPKSDAARLRLARKLLDRYARWHAGVPDEPRYTHNCEAALVQQVREFLHGTAARPDAGEEPT